MGAAFVTTSEYEDAHLRVIDKPVGLVVHPAPGHWSGTLLNGLLAHDPQSALLPRAGIVHRLDRDTTGVIVVARSNEAARSLVGQFKAKTVHKEYTAVVWGELPFDSDWIDLPLGSHPARPALRAVRPESEGGQPSSTLVENLSGTELFLRYVSDLRNHDASPEISASLTPSRGHCLRR